ncbi:hypothetical protein Q1695_011777 [Nippostrongylus brasiliensis]|nr:hypothetical protein Q1695_011777 [Nippostrongylus brasiliensis]
MGLSDCADDRELTHNPWFLLSISLQAVAGAISAVVSSIVAWKCKCLHFHVNCRILIIALLMLYILHSVCITILQVAQLARYLLIPDACRVGLSLAVCFALRLPPSACMVCFAFLQFAIVAERGVALWKRERYEKFGPFLGWSFTVISILISIASTVYVAADVDYEGDSVYCSTATDTTAERVTAQGIGMCVVELIALAGMFALNIFNTMAIKKFTKFFRVQSYQLRENASVIRLMLPLIVFQTLSYILFAAIDATIATVHMQLPYVTYRTLVASFYIIPYYTIVSPILLWYIIRWSQRLKESKMKQLTRHNENERDVYFRTYIDMWNTRTKN